ncbi:MAG: 4-diphosphocytidyl-2-C-methyl-D-erythritol kinase [Solirubrobacteraceae bacterium]|jgi:4-diphosphocytidyl-2-C-methyl-D-erythritol kinase|nr:4-diphosphocytidyl-2-C-methyl-D-erythritol kinase [Solirubrobacteraceae bacterium]
MTTLTLHAPGKVNLCLFVGQPREDGYHPLVSVFQSVSLADELTLEAAPKDAAADQVRCPGVDGKNLAATALAAYRAASGWDAPPVRLTIIKRIPVAAGMGGGSADAAAALKLAAQAAGRPDDPLISAIAPSLGADVPFALHNGRALVTGIGERVEPLPAAPAAALVLLPSVHTLSTPAVYAEADRLGATRADLAPAEAGVRAGSVPAVNDLQPAAISLCPDIDRELDRLHAAGAAHVMVSGSGPTVFGVFDDPERARANTRDIPGALIVEPV